MNNPTDAGSAQQPEIITNQWPKTARYIAGVIFLLMLIGLLFLVSPIAHDLVAALLLAFFMDIPIRLASRRFGRSYPRTALLAYLVVYVVMALLIFVGWRAVADYLAGATTRLGEAASALISTLSAGNTATVQAGQSLGSMINQGLVKLLQTGVNILLSILKAPVVGYARFVFVLINVGISVFLSNLLVLSAYTARGRLRAWIPEFLEREARLLISFFDRIWGNYLAGMGIFALVLGVGSIIEFWLLGVPYPWVFGVLTGLICLLPLVGGFLSGLIVFIPCLLLGSSRFPTLDPLAFAVIVALINDVICSVSYNFVALPIIGKLVRLPYWVTLAGVMMGFALNNILFAFLVIPLFSTLRMVYTYVLAKIIGREPFPGRGTPTGPAEGYLSQFLLDEPAK